MDKYQAYRVIFIQKQKMGILLLLFESGKDFIDEMTSG